MEEREKRLHTYSAGRKNMRPKDRNEKHQGRTDGKIYIYKSDIVLFNLLNYLELNDERLRGEISSNRRKSSKGR